MRALLQLAGLWSGLYHPGKGSVPWFPPLCSGIELVATSESLLARAKLWQSCLARGGSAEYASEDGCHYRQSGRAGLRLHSE